MMQTLQPKFSNLFSKTKSIVPLILCHNAPSAAFPQDHDNLSPLLASHQPMYSLDTLSKATTRRDKLQPRLKISAEEALPHIDISHANIQVEQKADPQCRQIISVLNFGALPRNNSQARGSSATRVLP